LNLTKQHIGIRFELHGNLEDIDYMIQADEYALNMVLRNLIENTIKHNPRPNEEKIITISLESKLNKVVLQYFDNGDPFQGDLHKLGQLFYKHNSPKGSGIGLYLIKKLTQKMGGSFKVSNQEKLVFNLEFMQAKDVDHE
jgi:signal transduction histidine kinase